MRAPKETLVAKKSLGDTVLGWFVVREEEEGDAAAAAEGEDKAEEAEAAPEEEEEAERAAPPKKRAPSAPPPKPSALPATKLAGDIPPVPAGAVPDASVFAKVFEAARISAEEQARVEKALALLESLPKETPKEVKRQIVEASLRAFSIPVDEIIESAAQEIQALEAYIQQGEHHTQSLLTDAGGQIEKLGQRILEIRKLMDLQIRTQQGVVKSSNEQKLRVQTVLEFFGQEAVARVVEASPKLQGLK